ncbi:plasmid replication protein, CyRepA1 family [Nostoc sp. XA010]|uniref:plasmid replication protein, CyRepA1 family n=1 Tax=Nostoc sp. XA010 TaxID=2780407 RepID=UPI0027DFFEEC|nr:plasmid replication protein, CyRepA1 family [Nostoc sp. XA010]
MDLKKYRHIEYGGWWCSGIDPLNDYIDMGWGCFKGDKPRRDYNKIYKFIKYEHPYKEPIRAFFLRVPKHIWAKVSDSCGIPSTEEDWQHPWGFWYWVWRRNVPVVIVEGAKKAGTLLTAGYAAIAIPGVNAGYRTPKDKEGNPIAKPSLIPDLKHFATKGRPVDICFDRDTKRETVQQVRTAINRMGRLLVAESCSVRVIDLPGPEKGVDDFIVAQAQDAFKGLYNIAEALEMWQLRLFTLLTYPAAIALNQRFLGQLLIPEHLLNSGTEVANRRVSVLKNLKQLIQNVLSSPQGKIYLSSADVSDCDVNYVLSLAGEIRVNPFVIVKNYQSKAGNCYSYKGNDPKDLIAAMDRAIAKGGHHLLCCSAQKAKSKWGTQVLEERFRRKFPHLRILRIDSESVADPTHPAYGCIAHLNEILTKYDLVITSPSLETGISIDIKAHFTAVWGIFQGVQPVNSVRQMLARLRDTVDRHIWIRKHGLGVVGNGLMSIGALLGSQYAATRTNIALLSAADNADYSCIDQNFQPESLQSWGKRACAINAEMRRYRESVLQGLQTDGYTIIDATDAEPQENQQVINEVRAVSEDLYIAECSAIANGETLSDTELKKLRDKRAKTRAERQQQRKAELQQRYGVEVTAELVEKDDEGWYPQLRMHYYLTMGREFLSVHDAKRAKAQIDAGENAIWKPDFNRRQMLPAVLVLKSLNILQFLSPGVMLRGSDPELQQLKALAVQYRQVIKTYLKLSISDKYTPIMIAQKLLDKVGLKLDYVGRFGARENRERVYQFVEAEDGREVIFQGWLKRDENAVSTTDNTEIYTASLDTKL